MTGQKEATGKTTLLHVPIWRGRDIRKERKEWGHFLELFVEKSTKCTGTWSYHCKGQVQMQVSSELEKRPVQENYPTNSLFPAELRARSTSPGGWRGCVDREFKL